MTRFMEKEGILNNTFGNGWFMWREWKVAKDFMDGFNKHIEGLVDKHGRENLQHNTNRVDVRIAALLKERETNSDAGLQKIIDFFAEVFVKYLYMKQNFVHLSVENIINILRQNYTLDNVSILSILYSLLYFCLFLD